MQVLRSSLLLAALSLFFLGGCEPIPQLPSKDAKAVAATRALGLGLYTYMQDYKDMVPLLGISPTGIITGDDLLPILTLQASDNAISIKNREKIEYTGWPKGSGYSDPWGNPYVIAWQKNTKTVVDSYGNKLAFSFFIWSFGANGINEFGRGDDLFSLNGEQMPLSRFKNGSVFKRSLNSSQETHAK